MIKYYTLKIIKKSSKKPEKTVKKCRFWHNFNNRA